MRQGFVTFSGAVALERQKAMQKHWIIRLGTGLLLGGGAGYGYYSFIGCTTGTCPLTSDPVISTVYGAVIGVLLAGTTKA